jgi:hypothetical protein
MQAQNPPPPHKQQFKPSHPPTLLIRLNFDDSGDPAVQFATSIQEPIKS